MENSFTAKDKHFDFRDENLINKLTNETLMLNRGFFFCFVLSFYAAFHYGNEVKNLWSSPVDIVNEYQ